MVKLLFLGLDGATWDVLDPMIDQGRLPTIARLVDQGAPGTLASTDPPVTFPAWRVLSSGKNPGKLGVYGWNHPVFPTREFRYPNATDYRTRDVWDYQNAHGLTTAVVNQPGTYPPPEVDGIFISGPESQGEDILYPKDRQDLTQAYQRHTHGLANVVTRQDLDKVTELIETNARVTASLAHEVDVLHHVIFLTDTVQHHLWDDEQALATVWQAVDRSLAHLIEEAQPETVVLASDHGFQKLDWRVKVNALLAEAGLTSYTLPGGAGLLSKLGVDRKNVLKLAGKLGITEARLAKLPGILKDQVPERSGEVHARRASAVHWEDTIALTGDGRGVHVADPDRIDEVRDVLASARDPDGQRLFDAVQPAAEVWHGPFLHRAPDLLITPRNGVEPTGSLGQGTVQAPVPGETWIAHHHPDGMFLAWGEAIAPGTVTGARLIDVMPTLLAATGTPTPTDVDGQVLDLFTDERDPGTQEPLPVTRRIEGFDEEGSRKVEDRLRGLGYLD